MQLLRDRRIDRWVVAGLIDAETAERIGAYERERKQGSGRRVPVLLALGFGGLLVAAGVLLFVSANWDALSPSARFSLVLTMVGAFHLAGAAASGRFEALATTFHAVGTTALGAGIYLAGQVFNLDEHWPSGLMLWAIGAWVGWALRRDWAQLTLALVLTPAWLTGEWSDFAPGARAPVASLGWFLLAVAFLTVDRDRVDRVSERAIRWLGSLMFLPAAVVLAGQSAERFWRYGDGYSPQRLFPSDLRSEYVVGWLVALAVPLATAVALRRRGAWLNAGAAVWGLALAGLANVTHDRIWIYPWLGIGCLATAAWGLREARAAMVNFATAGFAITVLGFYFDTVMAKMDKSVSLIGLGVLFLVGGYGLERVRRRIVGRLQGGDV